MHEVVKSIALYVAYFAEVAAALVITVGTAQAVWIYLRRVFVAGHELGILMRSRVKLGFSLSLGLGFLIGADIIKTAVAPTWKDIGQLAAIVAIRTVINIFLMKDMEKIGKTIEG